ncbi:hypothetical protein RI065_06545 [Mycoplasmatota bacterium zrk1]
MELIIIKYIYESNIFKKWHWFNYIFSRYKVENRAHPFADSIVKALINIDKKISNYYIEFIDKMSSLSGKEKDINHYDQLMQLVGELYILNRCVTFFADDSITFEHEPTCGDSKKNPEFIINFENYSVAVEVKCPATTNLRKNKAGKTQLLTRMSKELVTSDSILPFDNRVKDFCISANSKFQNFKKNPKKIYTILVIVWDDYIHELTTALIEDTGLLTNNSFHRDNNGNVVKYDNIDAIIIDRQLEQFKLSAGDRPLLFNKKCPFEYGDSYDYPLKVIFNINDDIPEKIEECFQTVPYDVIKEIDVDYSEHAFIHWLKVPVKPK